MKTFGVSLFLLLNCSLLLNAQYKINEAAWNYNNYKIMNGNTDLVTGAYTANNNPNIKGSCYLFEKWENNATILLNNEKYLIKNINYDALKDRFVSQISNDSVFVFYNLAKVFILGKTFIEKDNSYYQILENTNTNNYFLKKYYIKEIKPEVHVIANKVLKPGENKLMYNYYFYLNDNLIEVKLKKKDILEVFKMKKDKIIDFVKNNNLSYTNEEDVVKIYKFYETLLIN